MSEKPILFSAPMVRALLAGTKTQTRRVVKHEHSAEIEVWRWNGVSWRFGVYGEGGVAADMGGMACPYGGCGDSLWVKETWRPQASRTQVAWNVHYAADGQGLTASLAMVPETWRRPKAAATGNVSPLFMPRWASRITLGIVGVRVEKLKDISGRDAMAEGLTQCGDKGWHAGDEAACWTDPRDAYRALWENINGADSWTLNPWVWVVEFNTRVAQ